MAAPLQRTKLYRKGSIAPSLSCKTHVAAMHIQNPHLFRAPRTFPTSINSDRDRFDDAVRSGGRDYLRESKAGGREERPELLFGALVPAEHREHLQVLQ